MVRVGTLLKAAKLGDAGCRRRASVNGIRSKVFGVHILVVKDVTRESLKR
jgi:hypothetical protein